MWYEGTVQLLSLIELKLHLIILALFLAATINRWRILHVYSISYVMHRQMLIIIIIVVVIVISVIITVVAFVAFAVVHKLYSYRNLWHRSPFVYHASSVCEDIYASTFCGHESLKLDVWLFVTARILFAGTANKNCLPQMFEKVHMLWKTKLKLCCLPLCVSIHSHSLVQSKWSSLKYEHVYVFIEIESFAVSY